jgi:hypothetical protein
MAPLGVPQMIPPPGRQNMTQRRAYLIAVFAAVACSGCSDSTSPDTLPGRIRVFNNVFQGATASAAVPISVDLLIDSLTASPAVTNLANGSFAPGNATGAGIASSSNAATLFAAAGYRDIASAVHSFQARKTGQNDAFFRNANGTVYLPKQYITPFPYTCVLAGVVPPDGAAWTAAPIAFCMLAPDDPFTPPKDTLVGHTGLTSRMRFINAATFGSAAGTGAALTFTLVPSSAAVSPANITTTAAFRAASAYVNPPAGGYTLNISTATGVIYTTPVTFAAGDVRTILVYSTAFAANPVTGANHQIVNRLDNKF